MVREAMLKMEELEHSGAFQPAALVLVGDPNLAGDNAQQCTQAAHDTENPVLQMWHIQSSNNELGGDVLFCKGGASTPFDVPIGASYQDRGMRNDSHDCFAIALSSKRNVRRAH